MTPTRDTLFRKVKVFSPIDQVFWLTVLPRCYHHHESLVSKHMLFWFVVDLGQPRVWWNRAMAHDEVTYPNPDAFRPERFFDKNGKLNDEDLIIAYGFGKR